MRKIAYFFPVIIFLAIALGLGIQLQRGKPAATSPLLGKIFPSFSAPSLMPEQETVSTEHFRGNIFLVNIFASWCVSCRAEHPVLIALSQKKLLPILGINWKDTHEAASAWLVTLGNPYTVIASDKDGKIAVNLGITGAPESYLVDKTGRIIYHSAGPLTEEMITRDIIPLVKNSNERSVQVPGSK